MAENNIPVPDEAHRSNVTELQNYLRQIAYGSGRNTALIPDGVYGDMTINEVTAFQKSRGLPPTGEVNKETWDAIIDAHHDTLNNTAFQEGILPFADLYAVLEEGDSGTLIMILQSMLMTISGLYANLPIISVSGIYDKLTADLIRELQLISGLEPTGRTDIRTWNTLVRFFNQIASEEA